MSDDNEIILTGGAEVKIDLQLIDPEAGVYLDDFGNPTSEPVPKELLKKCRGEE